MRRTESKQADREMSREMVTRETANGPRSFHDLARKTTRDGKPDLGIAKGPYWIQASTVDTGGLFTRPGSTVEGAWVDAP